MNTKSDLLLIVTYAIIFLFVFLIAIIVFILKSRKDRISIEAQKKEIEVIAKQKTILLKELHHRVKNNLQLISGLLYLHSVKYKSSEVATLIDESQKQISSIALVHDMLYKNETLSLISMEKYLNELGTRLLKVSHHENIDYNFNVKNVYLPVSYATTIGLILNELITNSLKYAFKEDQGIVTVSLEKKKKEEYKFIYSDNGVGLIEKPIVKNQKSLGLKLITMFAEEIDAQLEVKNE